MENPTILVADGDPKNLQILRESLEAAGFGVILAADGLQAWQKSREDVPDLILSEVNLPKLDGFQLLEKLKSEAVTSSIPLMFLTNRREIQDRVRSLRGGVKDYMIKPLHVKEVIGRIRMILRRMERMKEEEIDANRKLIGRLEEFGVVDLIESFGVERKTGILTLHNEYNKTGEIYFRDGAVINAAFGNLKAEKAVYRMLPWRRGHFTMLFREINVPDDISVSNLGLLLQGFKRMEERERLFKLLPSPETTFVTTEDFRQILSKREITTDVAKFIALIDGRRDILQIIDESTYDDLKTLERLVKLYRQGLIKPGNAPLPSDEEIDITSSIAEPRFVDRMPTIGNSLPASPVEQSPFESNIEVTPTEQPVVVAPSLRETPGPTAPPMMPSTVPNFSAIDDTPASAETDKQKAIPPRHAQPPAPEKLEPIPPEKKAEPPVGEMLPIDLSQLMRRYEGMKAEPPLSQETSVSLSPGNGPMSSQFETRPAPASVTPEPTATSHPTDAITAHLQKLVATSASKKPKLAIIGRVSHQVENLLLTLLGKESRSKKVESVTFQHLEIGERRLGDGQFEIIGLSMEQQFTRLLDTVARDLVGYIVLVEAYRKEDLEYLSYLINILKTLYRLPMGIAIVRSANEKNLSVDTLRDLLGAEAIDYMRECDPSEVNSIVEFLAEFCAEENLRRWATPDGKPLLTS